MTKKKDETPELAPNKTELQKQLDADISKSVISQREQAGKTLSYLESWYVIDRMNQVFGQGNWSYQLLDLNRVFEGKVPQRSGEVYGVSYIARVMVTALIDGKTVTFSDVGYGDGTDRANPGKAYELAVKEAASDGFKRAAKNLGRSMGLALYDKTQEHVSDEAPTAPVHPLVSKPTSAPAQPPVDNKHVAPGCEQFPEQAQAPITTAPGVIKEIVKKAFKILEAQQKTTADVFKTKYLNGKGLSTLNDGEAQSVLLNVKKDFPELRV